MRYGYPASVGGGYGSAVPVTSVATSPFPFPPGVPWGYGGYPATVSGGFGGAIPVTGVGIAPWGWGI